jgi:carbamoyl-phosphate synthase large subunit
MEIVHDAAGLARYIRRAVVVSGTSPVLIDRYLQDAIEVDVDAVADGTQVYVAGIMEHIEEAGIHSGDSACSLPPYSLDQPTIAEIERQTVALARSLEVVGLMNVQFAVKGGDVYVLEVNPRASRTVPFVAKATGVPIAKIAARLMAGARLAELLPPGARSAGGKRSHVAVKEAVFPFARFPGVDLILGPEMKSTGEVMGLDSDFGRAFAKSQLGSGTELPLGGCVFVSVRDHDKAALIEPCRQLVAWGFALVATRGTARALSEQGLPVGTVNKVQEGRPDIVDEMRSGHIQLVFNTTEGAQAIADSFSLRRTALTHSIPYYTTVAGARAAVQAIGALRAGCLEVAPLQAYL